jgi:signal transduction histidine kinase
MGYDFGNPYSLLLLGNTVLLVVLTILLGRYRERRAAQGVIGVLVGASIWSAADAIRLAAITHSEILFWNQMSYVGVVLLPPAFLLFVVAQTNHEEWLQYRYILPVVGSSVVALVAVLTNPWYDLWRADETVLPGGPPPVLIADFGVLRVLWVVCVLLFVVPFGVALIVHRLRQEYTSPVIRRQLGLVLLGISAPALTSLLFVTRATVFDITPFGLGMMGLVLTLATMEYRLFDIVPIARDTVLENIESGVLVVDPEDHIVDANGRALEILDMDRDGLVGTTLPELIATLPDVPEYFGTVEDIEETVAVDPDAEPKRYYDVTISPVETGSGRTSGRIVLFSDVTEQIERREQLEAQKLRLEEKNERLDEFAGLVSHDLRNPIQVIEGNLELIEDPENEERFETISDATERMSDIVDQVLTLARTGGEVTETEIVVLSSLCSQVWSRLSPGSGASLDIETSTSVDADPGRLRQCVENILQNSVDHGSTSSRTESDNTVEHGSTSPDSHARQDTVEHGSTDSRTQSDEAIEHGEENVTITLGDLDDGFYIEDDGPGFPDDVLATDDSVVEYYAKEGRYGLQIVENAVEAHGWDLTITNGEDGGARFEIRTA